MFYYIVGLLMAVPMLALAALSTLTGACMHRGH